MTHFRSGYSLKDSDLPGKQHKLGNNVSCYFFCFYVLYTLTSGAKRCTADTASISA